MKRFLKSFAAVLLALAMVFPMVPTFGIAVTAASDQATGFVNFAKGTDGIKAFNKKIVDKFAPYIEYFEKNNSSESEWVNIHYEHAIYDSLVGILIMNETSTLYSYIDLVHWGYYYDIEKDQELTFYEYINALGVDYAAVVKSINKKLGADDPIFTPLSENISDRSLKNGIFDGEKAVCAFADYFATETNTTVEYKLSGSTKSEAELSPADKAIEKLTGHYYSIADTLGDKIYTFDKIFFADIDRDRIPELCIEYEYWKGGYSIDAFKVSGDEIINVYGVVSSEYSTHTVADMGIMIDSEGNLLFKRSSESPWGFSYKVYHYDGDKKVVDFQEDLTCSLQENTYGYLSPEGESVEITEEEYYQKASECNKYAEQYTFVDIPTIGMTDLWEKQLSLFK